MKIRKLATIEDYEPLVGAETVERIKEKAEPLQDLHVVNVNSTYYGGGVAALLSSLTLLMNGLGIDMGWRIIHGPPDFFSITKKMHDALQGGEIRLTDTKTGIYEQVVHDFVVVHDPQPLPLITHYRKRGPWIWRCHVELSNPNRVLWDYLLPFIERYDAAILSLKEYEQDLMTPQLFFMPAIDPFTIKNRELSEAEIDERLSRYGIPTDVPLVAQVSRFDRWKDPERVIKAFELAREEVECTLVLLGSGATDDPEGVAEAVGRAREAFFEWREQPASVRGGALSRMADDAEERAEELSRLVVREVGKPIGEARAEVSRGVSILRYYAQMVLAPDGETYPAGQAKDWLLARRYPLGMCALLTPWNFPVAIPLWKAAPALGYGNAVVLKPAPASTAIAQKLAEIMAGHLPEGAFRLVAGDAETGEPLVDHPDVAAVSFTGSIEVGRTVARQAVSRGAKVQCEMGGQNPSVVLSGADLDKAAETIAYAAMGYAGQKCTATSRVIAEDAVYDELRDRLVSAVEGLEVTDPEKDTTQVGPLIEEDARKAALEALERGGGRTLTGGRPLDGDGFYLEPTLVELEDPTNPLAQEEVFAPVTALLRANSAEDAVRLANDVRQGLVAAVFTNDLDRAMELGGRLEAGLVRVNAPTSGVDYHAPFGGSKASGLGPKEQGLAARTFYTDTRTLLISP